MNKPVLFCRGYLLMVWRLKMSETPNLRWWEPINTKCDKCGRGGKVGILRGRQNESYGLHCERCANKRLKESEKVRDRERASS